jgi:hypothetical protein
VKTKARAPSANPITGKKIDTIATRALMMICTNGKSLKKSPTFWKKLRSGMALAAAASRSAAARADACSRRLRASSAILLAALRPDCAASMSSCSLRAVSRCSPVASAGSAGTVRAAAAATASALSMAVSTWPCASSNCVE